MSVQLTEKQQAEGWRVVKFGEMANQISKRVEPSETDLEIYVGLEHLDSGSLRIKRHGHPSEVKGQKLLVRSGQIIFGKRRAYQRKVGVAEFDCICSAHAMVLEARPECVIPEFLPFFMQSDLFMDRAVAISEGSLSPTIKWKALANQEFPLPPVERQKQLLSILVENRNIHHLIEDAEISHNSLLKSVCREVMKVVSPDNDTARLPEGWSLKSLEDIAIVERGKFTPRPRNNPIYYGGDIPFIQTGDVTNSSGFLTSHTQTLNEDGLNVSKMFKKGSILITIAANIGDVTLTTYDVACTDSVVAIQPKSDINPVWLLFYLMQLKPYLDSRSTKSAQKNINLKTLRPLKIAVPPESQQESIASLLKNLQCAKERLQCSYSTVTTLRSSLMNNHN